eukprot:5185218-Pleurochrysis_carterae.AAC.2
MCIRDSLERAHQRQRLRAHLALAVLEQLRQKRHRLRHVHQCRVAQRRVPADDRTPPAPRERVTSICEERDFNTKSENAEPGAPLERRCCAH